MLEQFQQRILRSIPGIHWHDRITNVSILEQADATSIEAHIVKSQLSWAGHVRRMPDTRVPKQLLYAELSSGKRKTGRQWKRYKPNLKKCEMELQWENRTDDRACSRRTSRMGVANLEQRGITMEAQKRERGERTEKMTTTLQTVHHVCAMCVVEYVDQQSAFTATSALIEHKLTHHHYHHHCGRLRSSYPFARDC